MIKRIYLFISVISLVLFISVSSFAFDLFKKKETKPEPAAAAVEPVPPAAISLQASMEKSLKKALEDNVQLSADNEALKKKISELENYSRGMSVMNNSIRAENEKLAQQAADGEAVKARLVSLQDKLKLMDEDSTRTLAKLNDTTAQLEKVNKDYAAAKAKLETNILEQENRELRIKVAGLREGLDKAVGELAGLARQKESLARDSAAAHFNQGVLLFKMRRYKEAGDEFNRTVALDPANSDAYYNLGVICDEYLNDDAAAIANYDKFIQFAPKNDPAKATQVNKVTARKVQAQLRNKSKIDSPIDKTIR